MRDISYRYCKNSLLSILMADAKPFHQVYLKALQCHTLVSIINNSHEHLFSFRIITFSRRAQSGVPAFLSDRTAAYLAPISVSTISRSRVEAYLQGVSTPQPNSCGLHSGRDCTLGLALGAGACGDDSHRTARPGSAPRRKPCLNDRTLRPDSSLLVHV